MSTDCYAVGEKLVCVIGNTNVDPYYGREKSNVAYSKKYYDIEIHLFDLDNQIIGGDPFESSIKSHINTVNCQSVIRVYEHHAGSYEKIKNYLNCDYNNPKVYLLHN